MYKLIEWPDYEQAEAFRFNKVINEPDFMPLHVVRILAQAATLVRAQHGKLVATPLGKSMLSDARQGSLPAILFHIAFWRMDLGYFGRGLLGSWPQADIGIVLWSLSVSAGDWQTSEAHAAMHYTGAGYPDGGLGQVGLRHRGANPASSVVPVAGERTGTATGRWREWLTGMRCGAHRTAESHLSVARQSREKGVARRLE
jgi:hypothetical protein